MCVRAAGTRTAPPRYAPAVADLPPLLRAAIRLHGAVYERTRGRLGHRLVLVPTLVLRTVGRRSGAVRSSVLAYARDGGAYVVVASNGGSDRAPAWLHNVRAEPAVELLVGPRRLRGTARVVEPGDPGHERLWALVNGASRRNRDRFAAYQRMTSRPIALVVVEPVAGSAGSTGAP